MFDFLVKTAEQIRLYRLSYAQKIAKCQQIKQRNWKLSKFLKPYPDRLISFNLQRFSIGWNITTAMGEPTDNILGRHGSKSIRDGDV